MACAHGPGSRGNGVGADLGVAEARARLPSALLGLEVRHALIAPAANAPPALTEMPPPARACPAPPSRRLRLRTATDGAVLEGCAPPWRRPRTTCAPPVRRSRNMRVARPTARRKARAGCVGSGFSCGLHLGALPTIAECWHRIGLPSRLVRPRGPNTKEVARARTRDAVRGRPLGSHCRRRFARHAWGAWRPCRHNMVGGNGGGKGTSVGGAGEAGGVRRCKCVGCDVSGACSFMKVAHFTSATHERNHKGVHRSRPHHDGNRRCPQACPVFSPPPPPLPWPRPRADPQGGVSKRAHAKRSDFTGLPGRASLAGVAVLAKRCYAKRAPATWRRADAVESKTGLESPTQVVTLSWHGHDARDVARVDHRATTSRCDAQLLGTSTTTWVFATALPWRSHGRASVHSFATTRIGVARGLRRVFVAVKP